MQEPEMHPTGVARCPNGCDFDEIEIGTEHESFSALFSLPHQHIRCGKCGFNDDNHASASIEREKAIENWNAAVRAKLCSLEA